MVPRTSALDIGLSDYTIAFWMRTPQGSVANGRLVSKGSYGCTTGYMMRTNGANVLHENSAPPTSCYALSSQGTVNDGNWHHVVGVVKRQTGFLTYIDGLLSGSTSTPQVRPVTPAKLARSDAHCAS
jgi:hypothetical protein